MAQARPGDGQRESEDLRQWEAARRLAELILERVVYRSDIRVAHGIVNLVHVIFIETLSTLLENFLKG